MFTIELSFRLFAFQNLVEVLLMKGMKLRRVVHVGEVGKFVGDGVDAFSPCTRGQKMAERNDSLRGTGAQARIG